MGSGIFFPICALPIILIIIFTFNLKGYIKTEETKIYNNLCLLNCVGLIIEIACSFACRIFDTYHVFASFILKSYLVYLIVWTAIFTKYIFTISNKKQEKKKQYFHILLLFLAVLIIYILPINVVIQNNFQVHYTNGLSVNFSYLISAVYVIVILINLLKNFKELKSKKYLPVFLFFIIGTISIIIQFTHPQFLLLTYAETIICLSMYFTIENPDIKILDEVHRAKEITDNANEEKAMFLYNMTNELREITKDIDDEADNILNETDNKKIDKEVINNSAREIKASTARFTTMTNEILDISQIDSANIKIYNDKYNLKLVIKELVQIYKKKAEKKSLEFRTNIDSDLPEYLYGDIVGLKTSLNVILDNSVKYTEKGYVDFSVSYIMKNDIARLIISVEDSGAGMKAEELTKIFNKKDNDSDSLNLSNNLNNARKLITLMGGTIIPSSVYGKGTVMKVILDQKVAESDGTLTKYESLYDKKKVLLVDDSEASIKIINKHIKDSNIILDVVTSGKECLDKIREKEKFDLILMDEEMEPLDGITVMKKLLDIRTFNIPVILLTKNNDYEYNEEYLKYGFKDYILKPTQKEDFFNKINKYLK